jgi:hypothetical protein
MREPASKAAPSSILLYSTPAIAATPPPPPPGRGWKADRNQDISTMDKRLDWWLCLNFCRAIIAPLFSAQRPTRPQRPQRPQRPRQRPRTSPAAPAAAPKARPAAGGCWVLGLLLPPPPLLPPPLSSFERCHFPQRPLVCLAGWLCVCVALSLCLSARPWLQPSGRCAEEGRWLTGPNKTRAPGADPDARCSRGARQLAGGRRAPAAVCNKEAA